MQVELKASALTAKEATGAEMSRGTQHICSSRLDVLTVSSRLGLVLMTRTLGCSKGPRSTHHSSYR